MSLSLSLSRICSNNSLIHRISNVLTYASLMALADFRQTPITGHASIAFQAAYARFALALSGLWIAGVRNTA